MEWNGNARCCVVGFDDLIKYQINSQYSTMYKGRYYHSEVLLQ